MINCSMSGIYLGRASTFDGQSRPRITIHIAVAAYKTPQLNAPGNQRFYHVHHRKFPKTRDIRQLDCGTVFLVHGPDDQFTNIIRIDCSVGCLVYQTPD